MKADLDLPGLFGRDGQVLAIAESAGVEKTDTAFSLIDLAVRMPVDHDTTFFFHRGISHETGTGMIDMTVCYQSSVLGRQRNSDHIRDTGRGSKIGIAVTSHHAYIHGSGGFSSYDLFYVIEFHFKIAANDHTGRVSVLGEDPFEAAFASVDIRDNEILCQNFSS